MIVSFLLYLLQIIDSVDCVKCYTCFDWIGPPNMTFINITFVQLPVETPVCNAPKTAIFNTSVDRVECYATCTKSTVRMKGTTFYVRGCKESLYRKPPSNTGCDTDLMVSMCDCTTNFCNIASQSVFSSILLVFMCVFAFWNHSYAV